MPHTTSDRPSVDVLAEIVKWVAENQPTAWDMPQPVPFVRLSDPLDPLWFRMRWAYAPVYTSDPRTFLSLASVA